MNDILESPNPSLKIEKQMNSGLGRASRQIEILDRLSDSGSSLLTNLKTALNIPEYDKPERMLTISEVQKLTGINKVLIREKERARKLKYDGESKSTPYQLKKEYSVSDLLKVKSYFKVGNFMSRIERPKSLSLFPVSFGLFKGGVGKSTHSTHFAVDCALKGMRTLFIDLDPQASATLMFGKIPSVDIDKGSTLTTAFLEDPNDIHRVIKKTHYKGLDIVTSGLELQQVDICLPNEAYNNSERLGPPLLRLQEILKAIQEEDLYDIVVFDLPPNHGAITLSALTASKGWILPMSPDMLSFGSMVLFMQTLSELAAMRAQNAVELPENHLFRVLITQDKQNTESRDVSRAIRDLFGSYALASTMVSTIALERSSNDLGLLYDKKRAEVRKSKEAFSRAVTHMRSINDEIFQSIVDVWS